MSGFSFHPELFTHREEAIDALSTRGFLLFEHFAAVDLDHASFGIEVCGVVEKRDAVEILRILQRKFRDWEHCDCFYRDTERERGWKIIIARDPEQLDDFSTA